MAEEFYRTTAMSPDDKQYGKRKHHYCTLQYSSLDWTDTDTTRYYSKESTDWAVRGIDCTTYMNILASHRVDRKARLTSQDSLERRDSPENRFTISVECTQPRNPRIESGLGRHYGHAKDRRWLPGRLGSPGTELVRRNNAWQVYNYVVKMFMVELR